MQTIEHIIVVILFIIVVIQTIRSLYFKINYKALEELNEYHLEKIKDSSNESDHFEKANMYLREKIQTLRKHITRKMNRLTYLEAENHKLLCYRDNMNDAIKDNTELRNRVRELESLIAATSLKKVKSLNTALDEMNYTADKSKKSWYENEEDKSRYNTNLENDIANKMYKSSTDPYDKSNKNTVIQFPSVYEVLGFTENKEQMILQEIDKDEDQYNTTAEDNEEDVKCSCEKCNSRKDSHEA